MRHLNRVLGSVACLVASLAIAQAESDEVPPPINSGDASLSALPEEVEDNVNALIPAAKNREFVIAPLPSRSPTMGWTVALPAMVLYQPTGDTPGTPPWTTGVMGFYAENESWGGGVFHKMSLQGDRWRLGGVAFHGDLRYDFYGIGEVSSSTAPTPINHVVNMVQLQALRRVAPGLFIGLQTSLTNHEVRLDTPAPTTLPPGIQNDDLIGELPIYLLAPRLSYDTRDSQQYPTRGWLVDLNLGFSSESWGSDSDYRKTTLTANRYLPLGDHGVLAVRGALKYVSGDAPAFFYPAFGEMQDLRGYQPGVYRDRSLLALQAEYRHKFTARWGAAAFVGIGSVSPDFAGWTKSLPAAGLGLRYVLAPKNQMALRVEAAWGRGDQQFYVGLGEPF